MISAARMPPRRLGGAGKAGADGHANGHVVQCHRAGQHQSRRVEGVVAAGAHLAVVPAQADRLRIAAVVLVVLVAVLVGPLMAVAVVGLLVNPAVEQVGEQIADHNPAQQGDGAALPGRVGNQIKAHHAEHHPGGEPQQ